MHNFRIAIGLTAWVASGVMLGAWIQGYLNTQREDGHHVAAELWEFASADRRFVILQLDQAWPLAAGDPIYRMDGPESIEQVGEIRRPIPQAEANSPGRATGPAFEALLYPDAPADRQRQLSEVLHGSPFHALGHGDDVATGQSVKDRPGDRRNLQDVPCRNPGCCQTGCCGERDRCYARSRRRTLQGGGAATWRVRETGEPLSRGTRAARDRAARARRDLADRPASCRAVGQRDRGRAVRPSVASGDLAGDLLYDKSFLPEKNLTQAEWNRFVDEEAMPVLNRHRDDFVAVQRQIVEDIARNEKVRDAVRLTI